MTTTWYVSNVGNDGNPGSEISPFLTIEHAMSQAFNGDVINLMDTITTSSTIIITKQLNFIGVGGVFKSTQGNVFSIENSNISIRFLTIVASDATLDQYVFSIERGSLGVTAPNNYSNIQITNNTISVYRYGILVNGTDIEISNNTFIRSGGSLKITEIIVYQSNGLTVDSNTFIDTKQLGTGIHLTESGSTGEAFYNECNTKTGLITISNNIVNSTSGTQNYTHVLQDSFIGSLLAFDVFGNDINVNAKGNVFTHFVSSNTDLTTITAVAVYNNDISESKSGIVFIDSSSSVTLPTDLKYFVYDNIQQDFVIAALQTGNSDFTQTTAKIDPADLYLSSIVQYSANVVTIVVTEGDNSVTAVSADIGVALTIGSIIPVNEKYCQAVEFYGSIIECDVSSADPVTVTLDVPQANPLHTMRIYVRGVTIQPAGYPVNLTYASGTEWSGTMPGSANISVIDVNAIGSTI